MRTLPISGFALVALVLVVLCSLAPQSLALGGSPNKSYSVYNSKGVLQNRYTIDQRGTYSIYSSRNVLEQRLIPSGQRYERYNALGTYSGYLSKPPNQRPTDFRNPHP